ncbi:MAG: hypothetical protein M1834_000191 [Cirrosporium novae-zelandiae]|nr:MAG: hypothetical protein M1834_000191 [Cirrosporium novae-zelandiae]
MAETQEESTSGLSTTGTAPQGISTVMAPNSTGGQGLSGIQMNPSVPIKISEEQTSSNGPRIIPMPCQPNWLDSVGEKMGELGGNSCWWPKGHAVEILQVTGPKVANLLTIHRGELADCGNTEERTTFPMFMIGKTPGDARPTLLVISKNIPLRRKIIGLIKEEDNIFKPYREVKFAESPCPPSKI